MQPDRPKHPLDLDLDFTLDLDLANPQRDFPRHLDLILDLHFPPPQGPAIGRATATGAGATPCVPTGAGATTGGATGAATGAATGGGNGAPIENPKEVKFVGGMGIGIGQGTGMGIGIGMQPGPIHASAERLAPKANTAKATNTLNFFISLLQLKTFQSAHQVHSSSRGPHSSTSVPPNSQAPTLDSFRMRGCLLCTGTKNGSSGVCTLGIRHFIDTLKT